jgi:hypothetical protein
MRHCTALCCLILLLVSACGLGSGTTPAPPDEASNEGAITHIIVYWEGEPEALEPGDEPFAPLATHLVAVVPRFNLPAGCALSEHTVQALKEQERLVELEFAAPEEIALGERVAQEDRDWIQTDDRGFRVVEARALLFPLSGEYRAHLLVPSEGEPRTWGCWAVRRGNEIDTRWVEATEAILAAVESR